MIRHMLAGMLLVTGSAGAGTCQNLLVPAFFQPGDEWEAMEASHTTRQYAVANIANGVGEVFSWEYNAEITDARTRIPMLRVLGYVPTDLGARPIMDVTTEIRRWIEWYCIDGIYLDQVPTDRAKLGYYQDVVDYVATYLPGARIFLNHKTWPHEAFARLRERNGVHTTLVTFEGSYATYQSFLMPDSHNDVPWPTNYPAEKFAHLVYGVPVSDMYAVLANAKAQFNVGFVFLTDEYLVGGFLQPWSKLPSYYANEVAGVSCTSP